jgi:hypothetical protein
MMKRRDVALLKTFLDCNIAAVAASWTHFPKISDKQRNKGAAKWRSVRMPPYGSDFVAPLVVDVIKPFKQF